MFVYQRVENNVKWLNKKIDVNYRFGVAGNDYVKGGLKKNASMSRVRQHDDSAKEIMHPKPLDFGGTLWGRTKSYKVIID